MGKKYIVFIHLSMGLKLAPVIERKILDVSFKLIELAGSTESIVVFAPRTDAISTFAGGLGDVLGWPDFSPTEIAFSRDSNPCSYPWLKLDALRALKTSNMVIHIVESKKSVGKDWFTVEYAEVSPAVLVVGGALNFAALELPQ